MIRLKHIYKSYAMGEIDVPVLKDVSLHIKPHEFVSVLGPSGSGKSTLMNIIGCLDIPDSGEYLLEGENVADCSENELSKIRGTKIGFIFQQFNLICSGHGTRWTVPLLSATAFIKSSAFWRNRVPVCRAATIKKY